MFSKTLGKSLERIDNYRNVRRVLPILIVVKNRKYCKVRFIGKKVLIFVLCIKRSKSLFQAVKMHTILDCKCHGVSGSCQVKTCWKTMAPFSVVGSYLRDRYQKGILVTVDQSGNELVVAEGTYPAKPSRDNLVFLEESPDYCVPNSNTGSLGTTGRVCNKTSPGHGSCGVLCCGRGFNTIQVEEEYKCACKFHWCCYVKCNICRRTVDKHVCKSPEEDSFQHNSSGRQVSALANSESRDQNRPNNQSRKRAQRRKARKNKKRGASINSLDSDHRDNKSLW